MIGGFTRNAFINFKVGSSPNILFQGLVTGASDKGNTNFSRTIKTIFSLLKPSIKRPQKRIILA